MLHLTPKEMGDSHERVMEQVRKPPPTAIFMRAVFLLIVLVFCAQDIYHSVTGAMSKHASLWNAVVLITVIFAIVEASVADYIKKFGFYRTENGSIAYGFFLMSGLFTSASAHIDVWPSITFFLALITLVAGINVILRRFDFFDLDG